MEGRLYRVRAHTLYERKVDSIAKWNVIHIRVEVKVKM